MPKYIDVDSLDFGKCRGGAIQGVLFANMEDVSNAVKSAPAADVAPVVRCRECKYGKQCCRIIRNNGHRPDDYCSFGARMDGEV